MREVHEANSMSIIKALSKVIDKFKINKNEAYEIFMTEYAKQMDLQTKRLRND